MKNYTPDDFTSLIQTAISRPDLEDEMSAATKAYFQNNQDPKYSKIIFELAPQIDAIKDPLKEAITAAINAQLRAAFERGDAGTLVGPKGNTAFEDRWSSVARDGWDKVSDYVHEQMVAGLMNTIMQQVAVLAKESEGPDAAANFISDFLATGTFEAMPACRDMFINFADGAILDIEMKSWMPTLSGLDDNGDRKNPLAMPDGRAFHQVVDFPTGVLLVSDSIRVGKFPDQTHDMMHDYRLSLNYAYHRIIRTSVFAQTLGLVDIAVGDDGPGLVKDTETGNLFAGHPNKETDRFTEVADICHDYWGTMIVDRSRVVDFLVAEGKTRSEANDEIQAWLSDSDYHTEITVEPGTWNLYWDDDREAMMSMLCENDIAAPDDTRFVLSKTELDLPGIKSLVPPSET